MALDQSPAPSIDELGGIPVLDRDTLEQLAEIGGGGLGLVTEMFGIFATDQPQRLAALKDGIETNNMAKIMELSHAIKGSAGTIGAMRLRAVAAMLEAYGKGYAAKAPPHEIYGRLADAYGEARDALERHINADSS